MELGPYYIDYNSRLGEDFSEYKFDDQGVPFSRLHYQPNWKYNPITVCQYGLYHFNKYLRTASQKSKILFLNQANWLVKNASPGPNKSLIWSYLFDIEYYQIKAPWISGMAQGQALSVLLRAHQLTGEKKYLTTARLVWRIFNVESKMGGIISKFPDGSPVIEEYPLTSGISGVLNGFIFAVFGIYDFSLYSEEKAAQEKFTQFINSLKANLNRYDNGFWSYYDLFTPLRLTSKTYHRLHLEQLKALYNITGDEFFQDYYLRWHKYSTSNKCNLQWFLQKLWQKIANK